MYTSCRVLRGGRTKKSECLSICIMLAVHELVITVFMIGSSTSTTETCHACVMYIYIYIYMNRHI